MDVMSDRELAAELDGELADLLSGAEHAPWMTREDCIVDVVMRSYRLHHDCEGHSAGPYDAMGETVYCDGSCRRRPL